MSIVQSDLGKGCLHINAPVVLAGLQWRSVYRSFAGRRGVPGRHVCKGCTVRCRIHAAGLCKASARARLVELCMLFVWTQSQACALDGLW